MIEHDQRLMLAALRRPDRIAVDDVWTDLDVHVGEVNGTAAAVIIQAVEEAEARRTGNPPGVVVEGGPGSGRAHLLRWARERVQRSDGYFFVTGPAGGHAFWPDVVHTLLRGLRRSGLYRHTQLAVFLERLGERAGLPSALRRQIRGQAPLTPAALDALVAGVRSADPEAGRDCRFTLRALVLLAATEPGLADLGESWLLSLAEPAPADAERWGLPRVGKSEQDVAVEISRLLALTGPSLLAFDRIDLLLSHSGPAHGGPAHGNLSHDNLFHDNLSHGGPAHGDSAPAPEVTAEPPGTATSLPRTGPGRAAAIVTGLARGLADLPERLSRTVTVVACRPTTWQRLRDEGAGDRFRPASRLPPLPSREVAERLITARFAPHFAAAGFTPPYPTWPIRPEVLDGAVGRTPGQLIDRADRYVRRCLDADEIAARTDPAGWWAATEPGSDRGNTGPPTRPAAAGDLARLADRLDQLAAAADVTAALDPATEDAAMPALLAAGLRAWVIEQNADGFIVPPVEPVHPAAHAWLCESLDPETGNEAHWYFRGLAHSGARGVQARLSRLRSVAALDPAVPSRRVVVLRNGGWPAGPVGDRVRREFLDLGGTITTINPDDLHIFAALAVLLAEGDPDLPDLLRAHRPAGRTALFSAVLGAAAR